MCQSIDMAILEKLSEEFEISIWRFKRAFNIPLQPCTASTIKEAKEEYEKHRLSSDSDNEAQFASLLRWVDLCNTPEEAEELYDHTIENCEVGGAVLALRKWNELSLKEVDEASSLEDLKEAYYGSPQDSEAESAVLRKMYEIYKARA